MKLVGTGKGNKNLGDMYRDVSCLIIRQLEKEGLGILIKSLCTVKTQQKVAV